MSTLPALLGEPLPTGGRYSTYGDASRALPLDELWNELFRTSVISHLQEASTTVAVYFVVETLPVMRLPFESAMEMIGAVERLFGDSATQTARMLRISRPMVYHYREGMEPSTENRRRLYALAMLASELNASTTTQLDKCLKVRQQEGRTLLEFLSDEELDVPMLRRILRRNVDIADKALRQKLVASLAAGEDASARGDIRREREAQGRPVYLGDPDHPGKLIQLLPDGTRTRGQMVKRKFVPDE
jgi:hypothetical protein